MRAFLTACLMVLPSLGNLARAADAIIVIDGTAQMNAKFGQARKIDVVKRQVASFIRKAGSGNRIALWAFGTAPSKKCEDARALVPLQSPATGATIAETALATIEPKAARAPVLLTLQSALKADPSLATGPVTAVIVAGTGDDCTSDVCGAAGKLKADFPKLKLTVLGIGMAEGPAANFTCAAKALGGSFVALKNAAEFERTMTQALDLPKSTPDQPPPSPTNRATETPTPAPQEGEAVQTDEAPKAVAEKPAPVSAPPEPNTTLSAALVPGGPVLETGVSFSVYRITLSPTGQVRISDNPIWSGGGGIAKLKLADGKYLVKAAYGYASGSSEFAVAGGKTGTTVVLDAGSVSVDPLESEGGPAAEHAVVSLFSTKPALEELGRSSEKPAVFHVNAGRYKVRVAAGPAVREATVAVEPGKISNLPVALDLGVLEIETALPPAAAARSPLAVWHRLYRQGEGSGKPPVINIEGSKARIELPAGAYKLQTIFGGFEVETAVTVRAGDVTRQAVAVVAGEAKVNALPGKGRRACDAFEAGKDRKSGPRARAAGVDLSFILEPGLYDIVCRRTDVPSEIAEGRVQVVAGETQDVKFDR